MGECFVGVFEVAEDEVGEDGAGGVEGGLVRGVFLVPGVVEACDERGGVGGA